MADNDRGAEVVGEPPGGADADDADDADDAGPSAAPLNLVFRRAATATVAVLVVLLAGYGLYIVRTILVLVVIALFLAVSLDPETAPIPDV